MYLKFGSPIISWFSEVQKLGYQKKGLNYPALQHLQTLGQEIPGHLEVRKIENSTSLKWQRYQLQQRATRMAAREYTEDIDEMEKLNKEWTTLNQMEDELIHRHSHWLPVFDRCKPCICPYTSQIIQIPGEDWCLEP